MNVFKSIRLENCPPYKEVEFAIPKGLSAIYGMNRTDASSKNANGAGKSYLASQIPEVLYDTPVVGEKSDRVMQGKRELALVLHDGRDVQIERHNNKMQIHAAGVLVASGLTKSRDWLRANFPITENEFDTYVYQDARRGHPLVMGTSAQRTQFFTQFFGIDQIDSTRKLINAELRVLEKTKAVYEEKSAHYESAASKLKELGEAEALKARRKKLRTKIKELEQLQEQYQQAQQAKLFLKASKEHVEVLQRLLGSEPVTEDGAERVESELNKKLRDLAKSEEKAQEYADHVQLLASYENRLKKAPVASLDAMKTHGLKKLQKAFTEFREIKENLDSLASSKKPKKLKSVTAPKGKAVELRERYDQIVHQLEHAKKFGTGKCKTCGQQVDVKDPKELQKQLKPLVEALAQHREYAEYEQQLKQYQKQNDAYKKAKAKQQKLQQQLQEVEALAAAYRDVRDLPKEPKPWAGEKVDLRQVRKQEKKIQQQLNSLRFLKGSLHLLDTADTAEVKDYTKQLRKANKLLNAVDSDMRMLKEYSKTVKQLRKELSVLNKELAEEESLKLLRDAYSDRGGKRLIIQGISERLMAEVNKYARYVFPENFEFNLTWETQVNLTVTRKYGKRAETTDVRRLSGAEYTLFTLVLTMALLALVPSNKRSSVLILDEPSANMHEETRQRLITFVQVMLKVIPSIVIITPKTEETYPGAKNFTAVKEGGYSTLVHGHPSEIV